MFNFKLSAVVAAALSTLVAVPAFASEFEFNQSLDGLFIQSVELTDEGHYSTAKILYNAGTCDVTSRLIADITISGYEDRGYEFRSTQSFTPVEGINHQFATMYLEGYNIGSADSLNVAVDTRCEIRQYDYDPTFIPNEVENLGDSIVEETERVGDNVTEGVEKIGDGFANIFGW